MAADAERRVERARRFSHPLTTQGQREEIARRYTDGERMTRIAQSMGLKESTVQNYCPPRNPRT